MSQYRLSSRRRGRVPGARAWQAMGRGRAASPAARAEAVVEIDRLRALPGLSPEAEALLDEAKRVQKGSL